MANQKKYLTISKAGNFFSSIAAPSLLIFLLLIFAVTYVSQKSLRNAQYQSEKLNLYAHAASVSYFYHERKNDLINLSQSKTLEAFFANRALGMSMRYGLHASLLAIGTQFQQLLDNKRINKKPIYQRLSFISNDQQIIIDTNQQKSPLVINSNACTTQQPVFLLMLRKKQLTPAICLPYTYKNKLMGFIIAVINHQHVSAQLLNLTQKQRESYQLLIDEAKLTSPNINKDKYPSAQLSLNKFYQVKDVLSTEIDGTPFILSKTINHSGLNEFLSSRWYLISLGSLSLLIAVFIIFGYRSRINNIILQSRFDEAQKSKQLVNKKNQLLHSEIRKRKDSETYLKTIVEALPDLFWLKDSNGIYLTCNHKFEHFYGAKESEIIGKTDYDFIDKKLADAFRKQDIAVITTGTRQINEEKITYAVDGHGEYIETIKTPVFDSGQQLIGVLGIARDITKRKRAEKALQESNDKFQALTETTHDFIWEVNADGIFTYCSPQVKNILGYQPEELIGKPAFDCMPSAEKKRVQKIFHQVVAERSSLKAVENINLTADGREITLESSARPFFDERGNLLGFRGIDRDITERKLAEEEMKYMVNHDALTGLYNRRVVVQQLSNDINRANRYQHPISVFMLDIDHFKAVNDTYGHQTGDEVLHSFAQIIKNSIRNTDYAARYGGEEFVIVLPQTALEKAHEMAERLLAKIVQFDFPVGSGKTIKLSASIGVAAFPQSEQSWEQLINCADKAMYLAKESGRNQVVVN